MWLVGYIAVHRLTLSYYDKQANPNPIPDDELTGHLIIDRFTDESGSLGAVTGYRPPYHLAVFPDGHIEQMLPLAVKGAHAKNYNWRSWGLAVIGDFRKSPPTDAQVKSLIELCRVLAIAKDGGCEIAGHTELPGSSGDPDKVCPGPHMPLGRVRSEALICDRPVAWPQDAQSIGLEL